MQFETVSEKPVSKSRKKKEFSSVISTDLKNQEVKDIEKTEVWFYSNYLIYKFQIWSIISKTAELNCCFDEK